MAEQIFTQKISEDAAGRKHVSIGQTRDGKDEWITPVTMWEKNKLSGLYLPPGFLPDDDVAMPRVKVQLPGSENFAKDLTIQEVTSELELVKAELQAIKANQLSGDQKVTLSGTKVVESAPVTGIKTVTSTVAEVFAGSSRKANRSKLVIRNLHQAVAIRIGGSGITDTIGQSLEPGASVEIDFSPSTTVSIYAVSTAGNVSVEVLEV